MAQMGPAAFVDEVGQVLENKQGVKVAQLVPVLIRKATEDEPQRTTRKNIIQESTSYYQLLKSFKDLQAANNDHSPHG